ncbi:MAG TPA: DUF4432 family protein [bacterium]|nr:DUF4432 family protein [bacterium]
MQIFGQNLSRRELEARLGSIENVIGVRRIELQEGQQAGVEMAHVRTGAGLSYYVNLSRALDIGLTEFCGTPISWQSVNGETHPSYFEPEGTGWLRSAAGGLLMSCGLTQVGAPCEDQGEKLGIHGRIHHLPASQIAAEAHWRGEKYQMRVSGVINENRIFGENIKLTREIISYLGENRIIIQDRIENVGFQSTPHMVLYHFNFGFPLMSEKTQIHFPSKRVVPREPDLPIQGYDQYQVPEIDYPERVYYHQDLELCDEKHACVEIDNPQFPVGIGKGSFPLKVRLRWETSWLDRLIQWKMPGAGVYALGVEPSNCFVGGRVAERERGSLQMIEPGERRDYGLEIIIE